MGRRDSVSKPAGKGLAWFTAAALLVIACSCASPVAGRLGTTLRVDSRSAAHAAAPEAADLFAQVATTQGGTGRRVEFRRLTIEDGLSQSTVNCIAQDSRGFMWFGTQDGLNRYDGYQFRLYEYDRDDPHSLSSNWIVDCYRDRQDTLWFVTDDATLHRYDPAADRFNRYPLDVKDPHRRGGANILTIYGDSAGRLWIGTYGGGLAAYEPGADQIVYYPEDLDDPAQKSKDDNKV